MMGLLIVKLLVSWFFKMLVANGVPNLLEEFINF
jgi:hypothetical protein